MGNNSKPIHPVKRLRKKYNFTLSEMGVLFDKSGSFIAQIEAGFSEIPQKTFKDICKYFEIKPDGLKSELKEYKEKQKKRLLEQVEAGN